MNEVELLNKINSDDLNEFLWTPLCEMLPVNYGHAKKWSLECRRSETCFRITIKSMVNPNDKIFISINDVMLVGVNKSSYKFDFAQAREIQDEMMRIIFEDEYINKLEDFSSSLAKE